MKTYYYSAGQTNAQDSFICSFHKELKPKDWIIVHLYPQGFVIAQIHKRMDELVALTNDDEIIEIISSPIELVEYEKRMEKKIQAAQIMRQMEEMSKEVAFLEKCKKNAVINPKFKMLYDLYKHVMGDVETVEDNIYPNALD